MNNLHNRENPGKFRHKVIAGTVKCLCNILWFILRTAVLLIALWMLAAMPVVLRLPAWAMLIFTLCTLLLLITGFKRKTPVAALIIMEAAFIAYFVTLTPEEQFKNVE